MNINHRLLSVVLYLLVGALLLNTLFACGNAGSTQYSGTRSNTTTYANRSITFNLTPPTQYMDNADIGAGAIAGYRIYIGITQGGPYSPNPVELAGTTSGTVTVTINAAIGRRNYIAVTAFDSTGVESDYSDEINKIIY